MEMDLAEGGSMNAAVSPPNSQQQGIGEYSDRFGIPLLKGTANFPFAPDLGFLLSLNAGNLLYFLTSKIRCRHSRSDNVFQSLDLLSRLWICVFACAPVLVADCQRLLIIMFVSVVP